MLDDENICSEIPFILFFNVWLDCVIVDFQCSMMKISVLNHSLDAAHIDSLLSVWDRPVRDMVLSARVK